jgi:CO/xanthine dehydrogenase Mo-binding subunit
VEEVDIAGPRTSSALRAAGWAEMEVLKAALRAGGDTEDAVTVTSPEGAVAAVSIAADEMIVVDLSCGQILDPVVLRSYVIGAVHQALGWVTSEGLAVDDDGRVHDLTVRSFGILRPAQMPHVEVRLDATAACPPVNGSDAVFAATAAAAWIRQGTPPCWPTRLAWCA